MKKSKKNYVAIVLVVLLLALAVGYAAFSQTLTISGTVNAKSNWKVKFTAASTTQSLYNATGTEDSTAKVTDDKTVTVLSKLKAPGDGVTVTATITNEGDITAKIKSFAVTGTDLITVTANSVYAYDADTTDGINDIIITVPTVATGDTLAAGASKTFQYTVEWNKDSKMDATTAVEKAYEIKFEYEQDVKSFTGTQSFE